MLQKNNRRQILHQFLQKPLEEFGLRELSRNTRIAPPSIKQYIQEFIKERLVLSKILKSGHPCYYANREHPYFKHLKRIYIQEQLFESSLLDYIEEETQPECIILFGSCAKGEDTEESDIDLFVQFPILTEGLQKFEEKLHKKIHALNEQNFHTLSSELKNNIINGILLRGYIKLWDSLK